jgi:Protein of unknown function (DUF760)
MHLLFLFHFSSPEEIMGNMYKKKQVYELSKPSSSEVEGIVHQLAQRIHHKFFFSESQRTDETDESGAHASRDHLAKLLFW